jgi:hypothetical protein
VKRSVPHRFVTIAVRWGAAIAINSWSLLSTKVARAEDAAAREEIVVIDPEDSAHYRRSALENSVIEEALDHFGLEEDPHPEGKVVESVEVYVLEVFDERDPVPNFVNIFHMKTRDWVVQQQVLQEVGQVWDSRAVLETERNLRSLRQLSVANAVAAKGSSTEKVKLVVVVKDVWSLRLNSSWAYGSDGLDYLLLNPTEWNLGGIRAALGAQFVLTRYNYSLGGDFSYPRMFGSLYSVEIGAGVTTNRFSGENEGGYGLFSFSRPQISSRTKWAYGTNSTLRFETTRQPASGEMTQLAFKNNEGEIEVVPWMYNTEALDANYWFLRSFGTHKKFDLGFGLEMNHRRYTNDFDETVSPEVVSAFDSEYLPVSDTRIDPYVSLNAYEMRFLRALNIESLGLQEDFRLGYGVSTVLFAGAEALGSTRNHVGSNLSMGYTFAVSDGMLRFGVSNRVVVANLERNEAFASLRGRFVSPNVGFGRLHLDGYLGIRTYNYLNVSGFSLGGNNRLRGYPSGQEEFFGTNMAVANAEFRTDSVDILSAQVGLAAFYDVGDAENELSEIRLAQGAGAGLRLLFPQAERTVMRLDWGFPFNAPRGAPPWPGAFYFTFGQAFSMPDPSGGGDPW